AYFEALGKLGFTVTRNYRALPQLRGTKAAVFYIGSGFATLQHANERDFEEFEQLAKSGARLIIAAQPESIWAPNAPPPKNKKQEKLPTDLLKERWGVEIGFRDRQVTGAEGGTIKRLGMKPVTGYFEKWSEDWSPSVMRAGAPLFLERPFGKGSILLISDCRHFTNRVLLMHPDNEVLTAIPGKRSMIFDESHLGLEDTGTVVGLTTSHHLNWILLGFVVLAALYIWRSSVSFIPPSPEPKELSVSGQSAYAALTNLLIQSVPPKSLLHKAAQEWNASVHLSRNQRTISAEELALLPDLDRASTIAEYQSLSGRLKHKTAPVTVK